MTPHKLHEPVPHADTMISHAQVATDLIGTSSCGLIYFSTMISQANLVNELNQYLEMWVSLI